MTEDECDERLITQMRMRMNLLFQEMSSGMTSHERRKMLSCWCCACSMMTVESSLWAANISPSNEANDFVNDAGLDVAELTISRVEEFMKTLSARN